MGGVAHPPFHSYPSRTSNFECCLPWCQWLEVVVSIVTWSSTLKTTGCQNWQGHVISWFWQFSYPGQTGQSRESRGPNQTSDHPWDGRAHSKFLKQWVKALPVYNQPLLWIWLPPPEVFCAAPWEALAAHHARGGVCRLHRCAPAIIIVIIWSS